MKTEAKQILAKSNSAKVQNLEEKEIKHLPESIQKYIIQSGAIGKPKVKTARLKQEGMFNINGKKWTPMKAEQYFNFETIEFVWKAKASMVRVVDQFVNNKGALIIKLFGWIKMGEAKGKEVDQGEAQRYLAELIWFPSAFISDAITWEEIDPNTAKATLNYGKESGSVTFHLESNGRIEKITAKRYEQKDKKFVLNDWEISKFQYKQMNHINIPYKSEVCWKYDEGDLCYYKFEITDLENNVLEEY